MFTDHNAYRSNFKAKVCHEQVASLIDMRCFGYEDAKLQSCSSARPAMKLTGKEDEVMMQLVSDWWSAELAEEHSWHIVRVAGRVDLLVHFKHRAAGDYHAVCSFLRHQGSKCAFPCIWCEARDVMGKERECKKCNRHSCMHTPFTGINASIVEAKEVESADVGPEPAWFSTSIEASHDILKPRRQAPLAGNDKATDVQARSMGKKRASTCQRKKDSSEADAEREVTKAAGSVCKPHALEPKLPLLVHPDVRFHLLIRHNILIFRLIVCGAFQQRVSILLY